MATVSLKAKLTLGIASFQENMRKAVNIAKIQGAKIRKALDSGASAGLKRMFAAGGIGAALGGAALARGIKGAYDMGGALSDLMARTGATGESLLVLQQALADSGVDAGQTGAIINKMQRAMTEASQGSQKLADTFLQLGLDVHRLMRMAPDEQMDRIGQAINAIPDPARKAAAAMEIFGRSGGELLTMFSDPNAINGARTTLGTMAGILAKNAATFDTISDRLSHVGKKFEGFMVGVASTFAPAMLAVTAAMERTDFAAQGERFGQAMQRAAEIFAGVFSDPAKLFGALGNYLTSMFLEVANQFVHFVESAFKGIVGEIAASFSQVGASVVAMLEAAAEHLPGNNTRSNASKKAGVFERQEQMYRKRADEYARAGDPERAEAMATSANRALLERNRLLKIAKGELALTERIAEVKKRHGLEEWAQGMRGHRNNLFGLAADRFGAGAAATAARVKLGQIRQIGVARMGEMMGPDGPAGARKVDPMIGRGYGKGLLTGGLQPSMGGLGGSGFGNAYNRIRRGDSSRAAAEAGKGKDPQDTTNEILTQLLRKWE